MLARDSQYLGFLKKVSYLVTTPKELWECWPVVAMEGCHGYQSWIRPSSSVTRVTTILSLGWRTTRMSWGECACTCTCTCMCKPVSVSYRVNLRQGTTWVMTLRRMHDNIHVHVMLYWNRVSQNRHHCAQKDVCPGYSHPLTACTCTISVSQRSSLSGSSRLATKAVAVLRIELYTCTVEPP